MDAASCIESAIVTTESEGEEFDSVSERTENWGERAGVITDAGGRDGVIVDAGGREGGGRKNG